MFRIILCLFLFLSTFECLSFHRSDFPHIPYVFPNFWDSTPDYKQQLYWENGNLKSSYDLIDNEVQRKDYYKSGNLKCIIYQYFGKELSRNLAETHNFPYDFIIFLQFI